MKRLVNKALELRKPLQFAIAHLRATIIDDVTPNRTVLSLFHRKMVLLVPSLHIIPGSARTASQIVREYPYLKPANTQTLREIQGSRSHCNIFLSGPSLHLNPVQDVLIFISGEQIHI